MSYLHNYSGGALPTPPQQQQQQSQGPANAHSALFAPSPLQQAQQQHQQQPILPQQTLPLPYTQQPNPVGSIVASRAGSPAGVAVEEGRGGTGGGTGSAADTPKPKGRTRSSIACASCRRMKMKCEGIQDGHTSCKRCLTSGVPCLVEVGAGTRNRVARASAPADADDRRPSDASTSASSPRAVDLGASYEQRLASLEAEMRTIRALLPTTPSSALSTSAPSPRPPPTLQTRSPSIGNGQSPLVSSYTPSQPPTANAYSQSSASYSNGAWSPPSFGVSAPSFAPALDHPSSRRMTVSQNASLLLNPGPVPNGAGSVFIGLNHGSKRGAPDDFCDLGRKRGRTELDFIERGEITEDEAILCFDSYLATLNAPASPLPTISIPYDAVRATSSLLLAVLVAIGARAISHTTSYHSALAEANRLAQLTYMPIGVVPNCWDAKALIILSLYTGRTGLAGHVRTLAEGGGSETALFTLRELGEAGKNSERAGRLAIYGRTFLVGWIWSELYTVCCLTAPAFSQAPEVLLEQIRILRVSPFSEPVVDALLEIHIYSVLFPHEAYMRLAPEMRVQPPSPQEVLEVIDDIIRRLARWSEQTREMQSTFNGWGDGQEVRQTMAFYHTRMILEQWTMRMLVETPPTLWPVGAREHVRSVTETSLKCLNFGLNSRAWLQQATAAQYWTHVKLVAVFRALYSSAQLFPADIQHAPTRKILQSVTRWADRIASSPLCTTRDHAVVDKMRALAQTFSAFLSEQGFQPGAHDHVELATPPPPDIQMNLESLRMDGVIWGMLLVEP